MRVEGQFVFNTFALRLNAALAGLGLAYLPEGQVQAPIAEWRLVRVLADWCPPLLCWSMRCATVLETKGYDGHDRGEG